MNIEKLLDSRIPEDILLAIELMKDYNLTQIRRLLPEFVRSSGNHTFYTRETLPKDSRQFVAQVEVTNGIFLVAGTKLWYSEDTDSETCKIWGYPKI